MTDKAARCKPWGRLATVTTKHSTTLSSAKSTKFTGAFHRDGHFRSTTVSLRVPLAAAFESSRALNA
jgi:hypothetical protein